MNDDERRPVCAAHARVPIPLVQRTIFALAAACLAVLVGCTAPPDMSGFAEGSAQLAVSIEQAGELVAGQVEQAGRVVPPGFANNAHKELLETATKLRVAWQAQVDAMWAAARYARALESISEAGASGRESAERLTGAAQQFVGAVSTAVSATGIATEPLALAGRVFEDAYEQIARARANHALEDIMEELEPAIDEVADLQSQSLNSLGQIPEDAARIRKAMLYGEHKQDLDLRQSIVKARTNWLGNEWIDTDEKPDNDLSEHDRALLAQSEQLLANMDRWYQPYQHQLEQIAADEVLARSLIDDCARGLTVWRGAHADLLKAVESRQSLDVRELGYLAERILSRVQSAERGNEE